MDRVLRSRCEKVLHSVYLHGEYAVTAMAWAYLVADLHEIRRLLLVALGRVLMPWTVALGARGAVSTVGGHG